MNLENIVMLIIGVTFLAMMSLNILDDLFLRKKRNELMKNENEMYLAMIRAAEKYYKTNKGDVN